MKYASDALHLTVESKLTPHAELFSAFSDADTLTFTLVARRNLGVSSPVLELFDGYEPQDPNRLVFPFLWQDTDYTDEIYTLILPLSRLRGLYFASILFDSAKGDLRLSYNPASYSLRLSYKDESYEPFGLTVYDRSYETPAWFKGGILYQVFVDRFAKGSKKTPIREDARLNPDWDNGVPEFPPYRGAPLANNTFFGGTLWGVAEKLDYLASLGVTAIYLSPIFKAYSNHKYDTGDYMTVDEMFGGEEALDHLIAEARERGIGIILDGVFNHTGDDSRYFNKYGRYEGIGAYQSPDSPFYRWYSFEDYPHRYRSWWGIDILPAVNTDEPSYRDFICGEEGVVRHYLRKGISGWRLDVADELSESFISELRHAARSEKSDALILGEVWEDASDKIAYGKRRCYFCGNELDSVMNYPAGNAVTDYVLTGDAGRLFAILKRLYAHYPKPSSDSAMNLLGTHDTERILTRLSGVSDGERPPEVLAGLRLSDREKLRACEKLRLAWLILTTLPGVPCIYYGDEVGMEGYYDPFNRRPFPWGNENEALLAFYRTVGRIRREEGLFAEGLMKMAEGLPSGVFSLCRFNEHEAITVVVNLSGQALTVSLDALLPEAFLHVHRQKISVRLGESCINRQISLENSAFSLIKVENDTQC